MDMAIDKAGGRSRCKLTDGLASLGLRRFSSVASHVSQIERLRWAQVVTTNSGLEAIQDRWWPYSGNLMRAYWDQRFRSCQSDRCELFFRRCLAAPRILVLDYVRSGPKTSLSTFYAATLVLDEIARIQQANALVCHLTNVRLSDRLLRRWGWERHCEQWRGRHYIKRFYGDYPPISQVWRRRLRLAP